jgi:hypothetical protein
MSIDTFKIKDASKDQLEIWLNELRQQRKKGYEAPKRTSKKKLTNPFEGLDPEVAEKILKEMMKGDGG